MNAIKNRVQLMGCLGGDPEVKKFDSGKSKATFRMATNESYIGQDGEWKENVQWHNVTAWDRLAGRVEKQLKKGAEVIVVGKLTHNEYEDSNGVKRYFTEVNMEALEVIGKRMREEVKA